MMLMVSPHGWILCILIHTMSETFCVNLPETKDLVIVQKAGNWGKEILFNLIFDDTVVGSVSHDIP